MHASDSPSFTEDDLLQARERVVRLCVQLTGNQDAADDLAQETLLEAWRHRAKLHDPAARDRWLAAIARHVVLRWFRQQHTTKEVACASAALTEYADTCTVEREAERRERAAELQRGLAQLPVPTRQMLVAHTLHGASYATLARHWGVSEAAVAMRVLRGKRVLRALLATNVQPAATEAPGDHPTPTRWQETRIWCPHCGHRCLLAHLPPPPGTVAFRCPGCCQTPNETDAEYPLTNAHFRRLIGGLQRPRVMLTRTALWGHTYFRRALAQRAALCTQCGRPADVHVSPADGSPGDSGAAHVLYVMCTPCAVTTCVSSQGLIVNLPPVQQFWREHGRIRMLPGYGVEAAGQPAIVTCVERVDGAERLAIVTACATYEIIGIHHVGATNRRES